MSTRRNLLHIDENMISVLGKFMKRISRRRSLFHINFGEFSMIYKSYETDIEKTKSVSFRQQSV